MITQDTERRQKKPPKTTSQKTKTMSNTNRTKKRDELKTPFYSLIFSWTTTAKQHKDGSWGVVIQFCTNEVYP